MPNLRHVADLVVSELHHVDIVRSRLFAGRLTWTPGTGMSTRKHSKGSDVVSFGIGGEGFHLVAAVRHNHHQPLHPIRVFCKSFNTCKRFGLSGKGRVWSTVSLADFPTLSSLASGKEIVGNCRDRRHGWFLPYALLNVSFSTSATLRPSRCLLLRLASGPMLWGEPRSH